MGKSGILADLLIYFAKKKHNAGLIESIKAIIGHKKKKPKKPSKLTSEISPVGRGAVDCADSEAAEPVIVQLPVPDPEPQQDSVNVIFRGRLQREELCFNAQYSTST